MEFLQLEEMLKSKMNFFILNKLNKPKSTNNVLFKGLDDQVNWLIGQFASKPQTFWKTQFSTDVLSKIEQGWRPVVRDEYGLCLNCYHYGNVEPCMNHGRVEFNDMMSYSQYQAESELDVPETFKEFERLRIEEIRREEEQMELLEAEADHAIAAYYARFLFDA